MTLVSSRLYSEPYECPQCHIIHNHKTYHINVDGNGAAIVSPVVWEQLQRIPGQPFKLSGTVDKPPTQILQVGSLGNIHIVGQTDKEIRSGP